MDHQQAMAYGESNGHVTEIQDGSLPGGGWHTPNTFSSCFYFFPDGKQSTLTAHCSGMVKRRWKVE